MEDRTQADGLPSVAALEAYDKSLAEILSARERLMGDVRWRDFGNGEFDGVSLKISEQHEKLLQVHQALGVFRARFRTETVTTTKVVRA